VCVSRAKLQRRQYRSSQPNQVWSLILIEDNAKRTKTYSVRIFQSEHPSAPRFSKYTVTHSKP